MRLPEVTSPVRSCRIGEPGEKNGPSLLSKDGYGRAAAGDHHRVNGVALPPSLPILQVSLHYWNSGAMPRHPDTRQRIERAAVVLFASKGVDATTTKEIAAAVGISEGEIYRHFKSKDELVWHLFSTIGRASCRERVCPSVSNSEVSEKLKKKQKQTKT